MYLFSMPKAFLTTRVDASLKREIERLAKLERRSVSQLMEILLEVGLRFRRDGQTSQASALPPNGR